MNNTEKRKQLEKQYRQLNFFEGPTIIGTILGVIGGGILSLMSIIIALYEFGLTSMWWVNLIPALLYLGVQIYQIEKLPKHNDTNQEMRPKWNNNTERFAVIGIIAISAAAILWLNRDDLLKQTVLPAYAVTFLALGLQLFVASNRQEARQKQLGEEISRLKKKEKEQRKQIPLIKNDEVFSNTLYRCENAACETSFFRLYQQFDAVRRGEIPPPGNTQITETEFAESATPEWFEAKSFVLCPNCQESNVKRSKEFNWMKNDTAFPRLDRNALEMRRGTHPERLLTINNMLDQLEKQIKDIQEVESYQWYYKLNTPHDAFINTSLTDIRENLNAIQKTTSEKETRKRIQQLVTQLEKQGETVFEIPEKTNFEQIRNKIDQQLEDELRESRNKIITASYKK